MWNWKAIFGQNFVAKAAVAWVQNADWLYTAWISGTFGGIVSQKSEASWSN